MKAELYYNSPGKVAKYSGPNFTGATRLVRQFVLTFFSISESQIQHTRHASVRSWGRVYSSRCFSTVAERYAYTNWLRNPLLRPWTPRRGTATALC